MIQVFTEEGSGPPSVGVSLTSGSYGALRLGANASGSTGTFGYVVGASDFFIDGYRQHSAAERRLGNVKLTWRPDESSKVTLIGNSVALPKAQDALGLSRAQFDADPRSVDPTATQFNTRKTVDQTQFGVIYERRLDDVNSIRALVYAGQRNTEQFQAIPVATQANPLNPGGVISLGRGYSGTDLRWTVKTRLGDQPLTLVGGVAYDWLDEDRRGYQNFVGTTLGVQGALRRDENNRVWNVDEYVQAAWQFAERWNLQAGLRHSSVQFESIDHYIVGANPDDSGRTSYLQNLPVLALTYALSEKVHLYKTAGRGYETPTLNELAYRPNGLTGLNFALQAATSQSLEAGVKTRSDGLGDLTRRPPGLGAQHEIVTQTNVGGRATYQNAGATRRRGLEAAWSRDFIDSLHAQAAYTSLDAVTAMPSTCTAYPPGTEPRPGRQPDAGAGSLGAVRDGGLDAAARLARRRRRPCPQPGLGQRRQQRCRRWLRRREHLVGYLAHVAGVGISPVSVASTTCLRTSTPVR